MHINITFAYCFAYLLVDDLVEADLATGADLERTRFLVSLSLKFLNLVLVRSLNLFHLSLVSLCVATKIMKPTTTSDPMTMPAIAPPGRPPSAISSLPPSPKGFVIRL